MILATVILVGLVIVGVVLLAHRKHLSALAEVKSAQVRAVLALAGKEPVAVKPTQTTP